MRLPFGIDTVPDPYGQMPASARNNVLFPEPDGPLTTTRSPASIQTETWSRMLRRSGRDSRISLTIKDEVGDGVTPSAPGDFESCCTRPSASWNPGRRLTLAVHWAIRGEAS